MLPPEAEPRISSKDSPNCSRATRKRFFNQKEFGSDVGYTYPEVFATQSYMMESSKILPFQTLSVTH